MTDLIETILRNAAGIAVTAASVYLWYAIFKAHVRPTFVWTYFAITMTFITFLRAVFLPLQLGWYPADVAEGLTAWQGSVNQTAYIMLAITAILLARTHIVSIRKHYTEMHDDE